MKIPCRGHVVLVVFDDVAALMMKINAIFFSSHKSRQATETADLSKESTFRNMRHGITSWIIKIERVCENGQRTATQEESAQHPNDSPSP